MQDIKTIISSFIHEAGEIKSTIGSLSSLLTSTLKSNERLDSSCKELVEALKAVSNAFRRY